MSITVYSASVPVFVRMLGNLLQWLDKAQAHAEVKKFDSTVYLSARLAPDMLPFSKQIQIACDSVKFCVARLAGVDAPKFDDTEKTLDELRERVRKTITYVQSIPAAALEGSGDKEVTIPRRDGSMSLKGDFYLNHFVLPNLYFHLTTAYALLRHNGVDIGKSDFLGAMSQ